MALSVPRAYPSVLMMCSQALCNSGSVAESSRVCNDDRLKEALQAADLKEKQGIPISRDDVYFLLQVCTRKKDLSAGRRVHSLMVSNGLDSIPVLGDHLIHMFAACGRLLEAKHVFGNVLKPSVYTWNAIISAHAKLGEGERALEMYGKMQQHGIVPVKVTFLLTLKACSSISALVQGRLIHDQIIRSGFESDMVACSALVDMYGKCGNINEGRKVFDDMPNKDVVSWGAMLEGYAQHGHGLLALELFRKMQEEGIRPTIVIFLCTLKACSSIEFIGQGRLIQEQVILTGLESEMLIANKLIDMYAKCGNIEEAHKMFDGLSHKNKVSWGVLIAGYAEQRKCNLALEFLIKMQEEGMKPDKYIVLSVLKACGNSGAIKQGQLLHGLVIQTGLESDVVIGSILIDMYAKNTCLEEARTLFNGLRNSNVVSWGAMIMGYALHGCGFAALELFDEMQDKGIKPSEAVLVGVLKACVALGDLEKGRSLHEQIIRKGLKSDLVIGSTLVDMYVKCGSLQEAQKVFEELPEQDVVSLSAMMAGYTDHGHGLDALVLFEKAQQEGIKGDKVMFLCILKACGSIKALGQGRLIHNQIVRNCLDLDVVTGSTLVDMYAKCGSLDEASKVFVKLRSQDAVAWSALITGYVQHEHAVDAVELFEKMQQEGVVPNMIICVCMLKACGCLGSIQQGRLVHAQIMQSGFESDVVAGSSLVDMYVKCGSIQEAHNVFDGLPKQDVVSWSAMIAGYALYEHDLCALELYKKMQQEGIKPDKVVFLSTLKACGSIGAIEQGRMVHKEIIVAGIESDVDVGTALIDLNAKCGCIDEAYRSLHKLPIMNVVSWGAIIAGCAPYGDGRLPKQCLKDMEQQGVKPDDVIFLSILAACSHAGLLNEGHQYFKLMREDYGLTPGIKHYNCMVDLLGRTGYLKEAEDLLQSMPILPDIIGWLSLLSGCKTYGNMEIGRQCYDEVVRLDQNDASAYVLMSSVYAHAYMWQDADKMQELRKHTGAWKKPGRAWIEMNSTVLEFIVEDQSHSESHKTYSKSQETYSKFTRLSRLTKREGYVPELDVVSELMSELHLKESLHGIMKNYI